MHEALKCMLVILTAKHYNGDFRHLLNLACFSSTVPTVFELQFFPPFFQKH